MKEIWQNAAALFSTFIMRCLMDFEDQKFYQHAINAYKNATSDYKALLGRMELLSGRSIKKDEDPQVFWNLIDNEYKFWSTIKVPEGDNRDEIASIKVAGLHKVAENIGGWALYDVSPMIEVIDEMLAVEGGEGTELIKKTSLQISIKSLSTTSFFEEAAYLREKLDNMIGSSPTDEFDDVLQMHTSNDKMMAAILSGNFFEAKHSLLDMEKKCRKQNLEAVRCLAHSCFNIDFLAFQFGKSNYVGTGFPIVLELEKFFPEDWQIRARRIGCAVVELQKQFFEEENYNIKDNLTVLESELDSMSFGHKETDEALGMTWAALKILKGNIATEKEIRNILDEVNGVLKVNSKLSEVANAKIILTLILHEKYLHTKVSHDEIEDIFKLVEINYDSETIRNGFFKLLEKSEDAGKNGII